MTRPIHIPSAPVRTRAGTAGQRALVPHRLRLLAGCPTLPCTAAHPGHSSLANEGCPQASSRVKGARASWLPYGFDGGEKTFLCLLTGLTWAYQRGLASWKPQETSACPWHSLPYLSAPDAPGPGQPGVGALQAGAGSGRRQRRLPAAPPCLSVWFSRLRVLCSRAAAGWRQKTARGGTRRGARGCAAPAEPLATARSLSSSTPMWASPSSHLGYPPAAKPLGGGCTRPLAPCAVRLEVGLQPLWHPWKPLSGAAPSQGVSYAPLHRQNCLSPAPLPVRALNAVATNGSASTDQKMVLSAEGSRFASFPAHPEAAFCFRTVFT